MTQSAQLWLQNNLPVYGHTYVAGPEKVDFKKGPFQIVSQQVAFDDAARGSTIDYSWMAFKRPNAVAVLPRIRHGLSGKGSHEYIFTYQFKYPMTLAGQSGWILEIPAGMMNPDETPIAAAMREWQEETAKGYSLEEGSMHLISTAPMPPSPGGSTELIYMMTADVKVTGAVQGKFGGQLHEGESIMLVRLTMEQILDGIQSGAIYDMKTLLAVYHCLFAEQMEKMIELATS